MLTSEELFFSCCESVAASRQRHGHHDQVPAKNNERRCGHRPRRTRIIQHCTRVEFTIFRCSLADLFFSCCDSVAAPRQRPWNHDQVPAKNNKRRRRHLPRRTSIIQRFTRVKFNLIRCTSAESFFSCCGSVAAPRQRPGHHDQVSAKNN